MFGCEWHREWRFKGFFVQTVWKFVDFEIACKKPLRNKVAALPGLEAVAKVALPPLIGFVKGLTSTSSASECFVRQSRKAKLLWEVHSEQHDMCSGNRLDTQASISFFISHYRGDFSQMDLLTGCLAKGHRN